jgi:localization factor PodJL
MLRENSSRPAETRVPGATSAEIEALSQQIAAMSRMLEDVAPRSHLAALEGAMRDLANRIDSSRDDGMREAVLAPIENLAEDVRRAVAEMAEGAQLEVLSSQLRDVGAKVDVLRETGGADRATFLKACAQSDEIRAMLAAATERMAPLTRIEQQIAHLAEGLEQVSRQSSEAGAREIGWAQSVEGWRGIETRLDELAARLDGAGREAGLPEKSALEPLLRALTEKLDTALQPQAEAGALEALERQVAQVSQRLDQGGNSSSGGDLRVAIEHLAQRFEQTHEAAREAARDVAETAARQAARHVLQEALAKMEALAKLPAARTEHIEQDLADLRDQRDQSERRTQETLSAVHETLEKVVDRLAMLEEDVSETRAAQSDRDIADLRQHGTTPFYRESALHDDFDVDGFLRAPGAGRPPESDDSALTASAKADNDFETTQPPSQTSYIDAARRALAARSAAEAAEKAEHDKLAALLAETSGERGGFVRPKVGGDSARRSKSATRGRLAAVLSMAGLVLALGAYQAWRIFDEAPNGLVQSAPETPAITEPLAKSASITPVEPAPGKSPDGGDAINSGVKEPTVVPPEPKSVPAAASPVAPDAPLAPAGPPATAAPATPSPTPAPAGASALPSMIGSATSLGKGATLDPLAVGTIGARPGASGPTNSPVVNVKELADKGDAAAQYEMGARYAEGRLVARDSAAAVGWFEKAAAQGQAQAQYRLGAIYEKGVGAPRDVAKARDYYAKAAEQGNVRAMHNLAVLDAEGIEGRPDYAGAAQWFRRAADYGVRDSQFNLAILYARGMGVGQSLPLSYVWFAIAAQQGDADAAKKRDEVAGRLDADTLEKAKKQASDFRARAPLPQVNEPPAIAPGPAAAIAPRRAATKI